jgi:hypothetical protein
MEQAATRLLARDQVESPLENGSLIVPAIILFPPEEAKLHRQLLKSTMCLCVIYIRQDHTSQDRASQHYASQGYRNPRFQGHTRRQLGIEKATQDPPASSPRRHSTSSAISTTASLLRELSQHSHRLPTATLLPTNASPSNAPGNTKNERQSEDPLHLTSLTKQ